MDRILDRGQLIELVTRLMAGAYNSDAGLDRDIAVFSAAVPHPRASDLIYHWDGEFDREPTVEDIVDRALTYRPTVL
ncbi:hypothetical protein GCM10029976_053040 [Kribbella albertanoniae]|uniref:Colicin immunity protein n=1 Tax=Kribbella albertanoniae TaxID=1266829 RepID=A0A4V2XN37_9ACTN|nr:hypothetical protein [Kribbella albertanoniae]TDC16616.1 hypothetical protein E1261_38665 [Kribbella albertanoniae]